jgi:hypothetical protein
MLNKWKYYFVYSWNTEEINEVSQTEIHVAGSSLHDSSFDQYAIHNKKLKKKMHKSPGTDHNLADLVQEIL